MMMTRTAPCTAAPMAGRVAATRSAARRAPLKAIVRAQAEPEKQQPAATPSTEMPSTSEASTSAPSSSAAAVVADPTVYTVFGTLQETINGRLAMLGFVTAVLVERFTNQSVLSQLAGKYANDELIEKSTGFSDISYGFVVVLISLATFAPLVFNQEKPGKRSFGPFTPGLELALGRAAMMGFSGLLVVEMLKGNTALF